MPRLVQRFSLGRETPPTSYLVTPRRGPPSSARAYRMLDQIKFNDRRSLGATLGYKLSADDTLSFSYQYGQFGSQFDGNQIVWTIQNVTTFDFSPTAKFTAAPGTSS